MRMAAGLTGISIAVVAAPAQAQFEPMFNPVQMANDRLSQTFLDMRLRNQVEAVEEMRREGDRVQNEGT